MPVVEGEVEGERFIEPAMSARSLARVCWNRPRRPR